MLSRRKQTALEMGYLLASHVQLFMNLVTAIDCHLYECVLNFKDLAEIQHLLICFRVDKYKLLFLLNYFNLVKI